MRLISTLCAATITLSASAAWAQEAPAYKPLRLVVMTSGVPSSAVQESLQYILAQSPHVLVLSEPPLRQRLDAMGLSDALLKQDVSLATALADVGAESALLWWVEGDRVIARIFDPQGGVHTITHPLGATFSHEQARAFLREAFDKVAPSVLQARKQAEGSSQPTPLPPARAQAQTPDAAPPAAAPADPSNTTALAAADPLKPGGVIPRRLSVALVYLTGGNNMRFNAPFDQGSSRDVGSPNKGGGLTLALWSDRVAGLYLGGKLRASYQDYFSAEPSEKQLSALELRPQAAARLAFSRIGGVELGVGPVWQDNSFRTASSGLPQSVSRLGVQTDLSLIIGAPSWWVLPTFTASYWRLLQGTYDQWNTLEAGNGVMVGANLRIPLGERFAISLNADINYESMTVLPPDDEFAWRGQGSLSFIGANLGAGLIVSY